jgi:hypothetical protein
MIERKQNFESDSTSVLIIGAIAALVYLAYRNAGTTASSSPVPVPPVINVPSGPNFPG